VELSTVVNKNLQELIIRTQDSAILRKRCCVRWLWLMQEPLLRSGTRGVSNKLWNMFYSSERMI